MRLPFFSVCSLQLIALSVEKIDCGIGNKWIRVGLLQQEPPSDGERLCLILQKFGLRFCVLLLGNLLLSN